MTEAPVATDSTIDADCIVCGYQLRGLDSAGMCPECGTPIKRSLHGDRLRYADQEWVGRVHLGMRLMTWSVIGLFVVTVLFIAGFALDVLVRQTAYEAMFDTIVWLLTWPVLFVAYAVPVALFAGLWQATTTEPRELNSDNMRPATLRALSALVIPVIVGWLTFSAFGSSLPAWPWIEMAVGIIAFAIVVVHMTMFNDWLQVIDRRCAQPNEKRRKVLAKYRKQGIGCAVIVLLFTLYSVTMAIFRGTAMSAASLGIVVYIWFAVLSFSRGAAKRIAIERAIAEELASNGQPTPPAEA